MPQPPALPCTSNRSRSATKAASEDCGDGPLPSGIVCYEGQLLVETFKVKVTDGATLDMKAPGRAVAQGSQPKVSLEQGIP